MKKKELINELFKAKIVSIIGDEKIQEIIDEIKKSLEGYVETDLDDDYYDTF